MSNTDMLNGYGVAAEMIIVKTPDLARHLADLVRESYDGRVFWAAYVWAITGHHSEALLEMLGRGGDVPGKPTEPSDLTISATYAAILLAQELAQRSNEVRWQKATAMMLADFERVYLMPQEADDAHAD